MTRRLACLLACALLGCAPAEFRPVDADPSTPTPVAAAWYDLVGDGGDAGDVRVWSTGAPRSPAPGVDGRRQLLVGLRIRNADDRAVIRLDLPATALLVLDQDGRQRPAGPPLEVRGALVVPPRLTREVELLWALPDDLSPWEVAGYEVSWALDVDGRRHTHTTVFRRALPASGPSPAPSPAPGPHPHVAPPWPGGWSVSDDDPRLVRAGSSGVRRRS